MAATRSHAIARLVLRQIATSPVVQLSKRRQNSSTRSVRCHSAARELVLLPCSSRQLPLAFRSFATSSTSRSPSPEKVIKDPYHPSGIYFHQLPESDQYAISFLSTPPSSPTSASIVAFVTPPPSTRTPIYDLIVEKPDLVIANKAFTQLMHDTLKQECVPQDGLLEYEAALRKDGWAHLNDQRHPLMPGRIATPENIVASVAFIDGELKTDSYEPNDVHRIVTGEEGFMELRSNWLMFIKNACEKVN